jgi:hypothetical protein
MKSKFKPVEELPRISPGFKVVKTFFFVTDGFGNTLAYLSTMMSRVSETEGFNMQI